MLPIAIREKCKQFEHVTSTINVVIVGAGAAGIELACCTQQLLFKLYPKKKFAFCIINQHADLKLALGSDSLGSAVHDELPKRNIKVIHGQRVTQVLEKQIQLTSQEFIPYDMLLWSAGAAASPFCQQSGLALDSKGYIQVLGTLQTASHANVFAAGDCASVKNYESTPKAGVFAVRQGPILAHNLLQVIQQSSNLQTYIPQSSFMKLINLGNACAISEWHGIVWNSYWMWLLKDKIDRGFMQTFGYLQLSNAS